MSEIVSTGPRDRSLQVSGALTVPAIVATRGPKASKRFLEFFAGTIRNPNTRAAYARAVCRFLAWCEDQGLQEVDQVEPLVVSAYIEQLGNELAAPSVKQHLAAIRMCFDHLVVGQVLPVNPASSVRGPKHVVRKGKTPVLSSAQARRLLDAISTADLVGLRDRALIGVMVYSFARVSAVCAMRVEDYHPDGKRWWIRLHEKGGKFHEVPAHHNVEAYLDAYIEAASIEGQRQSPLFRTIRKKELTDRPLTRNDVLRMVKRRAGKAGLPSALVQKICSHTFRATGITAYLENGGTIENAQKIAAHESPRTTKLYDRTNDELTLDEIERISI